MKRSFRAVFFDLDNTLVDFSEVKETACRAAAEAMVKAGLQMSTEEAYRRLMEKYFTVGIESDIAFSEFLKSEGQFNHKILAAAINAYLEAKSKWLKPYPKVKTVLERLKKKGVFLAVVTDAPKTKAYQRLLGMGIEQYFRFVVGFEDTESLKDSGLPLALALEILKNELPDITNSEILIVGDSVERDILPGKRAGLKTALSKYGQKLSVSAAPDYELADIIDLLGI